MTSGDSRLPQPPSCPVGAKVGRLPELLKPHIRMTRPAPQMPVA